MLLNLLSDCTISIGSSTNSGYVVFAVGQFCSLRQYGKRWSLPSVPSTLAGNCHYHHNHNVANFSLYQNAQFSKVPSLCSRWWIIKNFRFVCDNANEDASTGVIREASFFIKIPTINVLTSYLLILPALWINGWQIYQVAIQLSRSGATLFELKTLIFSQTLSTPVQFFTRTSGGKTGFRCYIRQCFPSVSG